MLSCTIRGPLGLTQALFLEALPCIFPYPPCLGVQLNGLCPAGVLDHLHHNRQIQRQKRSIGHQCSVLKRRLPPCLEASLLTPPVLVILQVVDEKGQRAGA